MMAYPALLAARTLCRGPLATPLVGALGAARPGTSSSTR